MKITADSLGGKAESQPEGPSVASRAASGSQSLRGGASGVTPRPKVARPLDDWLVDLRLRRTRHQILDSLLWKLAVF
jgi:hypothetical protein